MFHSEVFVYEAGYSCSGIYSLGMTAFFVNIFVLHIIPKGYFSQRFLYFIQLLIQWFGKKIFVLEIFPTKPF